MYLYVELWKAKPTWMALPQQQRGEYMAQLGPAIAGVLGAGVELVGWAVANDDTPYPADFRYIAVWKMPNEGHVRQFEKTVEGAGWYNYFEQVNARGELTPPDPVIGDMINL